MSNNNLNYEDYPAIGDILITNFGTDQPIFEEHYKNMNASFYSGFSQALEDIREIASVFAETQGLKEITTKIYETADEVKAKLNFLKDYLEDANLDFKKVANIRAKLGNRNIEGAIKDLRDLMVYGQEHLSILEQSDMPNDYLDYFPPKIKEMENLNSKQNQKIGNKKDLVAENIVKFQILDDYFKKICNRGKKLFPKPPHKDRYTMIKLIKLVRVQKKTPKDPEQNK